MLTQDEHDMSSFQLLGVLLLLPPPTQNIGGQTAQYALWDDIVVIYVEESSPGTI